ncbi:MAG: DUF1156 domain-containing protein [Bacteroidia bacterium]|nr:DUF1156 domain-containing protein [Bacteroidia bacterium]
MNKAIEIDFPFEKVDPIAEKESYRKEINRPIYHLHKWWAQRLGSVFRAIVLGATLDDTQEIWAEFYHKHDLADKIILDPFMGSGTSIGEATKLGCKVIGCDINPVSSFIVRQALKNVDTIRLIEEFEKLEKNVKPQIQKYYVKTHPKTQEVCLVLYYFWVKVVRTPDGKEIPLFSNYVFSKNAYVKKQPVAKILCPKCFAINQGEYDTTALVCINCNHAFNPQDGPVKDQYVFDMESGQKYKILDLVKAGNSHPPNQKLYASLVLLPNGTKEYLPINDDDLQLYREACETSEKLALPFANFPIDTGYNTKQAINYNYKNWKDFFNPRQYLCLTLLLEEILKIEDKEIRDLFICLFSGTLEFNNMFCSFKGEGTGAVRHLFSHHILKPERTPLENSVWGTDKSSGTFYSLFKSRVLKANEYLSKPFEIQILDGKTHKRYCNYPISVNYVESFEELLKTPKGCLILNGDSAQLPIPSKSIDAIITDPPYFDFVNYSELADFFYAWLKPALKDDFSFFEKNSTRRKEEVQNKDEEVFSHNLSRVFKEGARVLKEDGLMVFSFHHSKIPGWLAIYNAIIEAGFTLPKPIRLKLKCQ